MRPRHRRHLRCSTRRTPSSPIPGSRSSSRSPATRSSAPTTRSRPIDHGKHVVMVNVEADCMVGPILRRARKRPASSTRMAYGDQPALICELVDWCRTRRLRRRRCGQGHEVPARVQLLHARHRVGLLRLHRGAAGRAATSTPRCSIHSSTARSRRSRWRPSPMRTGLDPADEGLDFPPVGVDDLRDRAPAALEGGLSRRRGTVELVSSLNRDGRPSSATCAGASTSSSRRRPSTPRSCFGEYGLVTDPTGRYTSLYRPYHLIGLELGVSVASAVLRDEATGAPTGFRGDVVTVAKTDLPRRRHARRRGRLHRPRGPRAR